MTDTMTPTLSSSGAMSVLEIRSATSMNSAPAAIEAGITNLLSPPMSILTMWGATSPTNPMMPQKLTMAATHTDTRIMQTVLNWLTFSPRLAALSSPRDIRFRLRLQAIMKTEHTAVNRNGRVQSPHLAPSRVPICQR